MDINQKISTLKQSRLFKDSFWAVFGNGMGNALIP